MIELVNAIQTGDVATLERLLERDPSLATTRIVDKQNVGRTPLHILADWPGHRPSSKQTVDLLVRYGADLNASVNHPVRPEAHETPLHWAASSDDVALIDALLDAGADIEVPGAIFTSGTPMSDAVVFAQWKAARRLLERGAKTTLWQAAALGLLDEVKKYSPSKDEITNAFWNACRGGQREVAEYLLAQGADPTPIGPDGDTTPLQAAQGSGNEDLVEWLRRTLSA